MERALLGIALILIAAEVGGFVSDRLRLTRVAGQIGAGLIVGPSVLGLVQIDGQLQLLASVGALVVLAIAGLETDVAGLRTVGRPAVLAAIGGVVLPFALGAGVAHAFGYPDAAALFVGAILTATSVGISAAALRELGLGRSRAGTTILGAAVIDDVLGLAVLALVIAVATGSGGSPLTPLLAMAAVLVGAFIFLRTVGPRLPHLIGGLQARGGGIAGMLGLVIVVGWVFQSIGGLAAITGAYFVGLAVNGSHVSERVRVELVHAGEALFIPVFLVGIGLSVDIREASPALLGLTAAIFAVAVAGKLLGCSVGALAGGLGGHASLGVGMGMVARGEVAMVAATLGLSSGVIDNGLYAACVLMALATTMLTPVLLAVWARRQTWRAGSSRASRQRATACPAPLSPLLQTDRPGLSGMGVDAAASQLRGALVLLRREHFPAALEALDAAVAQAPDWAESHAYRSAALLALGRPVGGAGGVPAGALPRSGRVRRQPEERRAELPVG